MNLEFIKPVYSAVKSVNGMTGDVVIEVPEADLTGYATEEYVSKKIAEAELAEGDVDLSAYYTKSETEKKINEAVAAIDIPETDLTGYATEEFVNQEIAKIELTPGPIGPKGDDGYTPVKGVDYFDGQDGKDGQDGYTPQKGIDYFDGKDGQDGKDYVLTDADKQEIAGMVEVSGEGADLSDYYTKTETDKAISDAVGAIEIPEAEEVKVDGTSIVKDKSGAISAVVGGAIIETEEFDAFSWNGTVSSDDALIVSSISHLLEDISNGATAHVTLVVDGEEYVIEESPVDNVKGVVTFNNLSDEGCPVDEIEYSEDEMSFSANDSVTITAITIVANAAEIYETINGNFIPVGTGLAVTPKGLIRVDQRYIDDLIGSYLEENLPNGEEVSY